jgi:hypothetical protein
LQDEVIEQACKGVALATILDKARNCFPPVRVDIFPERGRCGESCAWFRVNV